MNKRLITCLFAIFLISNGQAQSDELPLFSFGAIADVQYCDCDSSNTRFYRASPAKLEAALLDLAGEELAFIVHVGDLIDREFNSFDTLMPLFELVDAPVYFVLGNHEFSVADSLKRQVPSKLGLEERYYDFSVENWRFVATDGNDQSLYAYPDGTRQHRKAKRTLAKLEASGKQQAQTWNGGMSRKQMKWLRRVLADATEKSQRIILFSHFPLYPPETHNLWNDQEIIEILEETPGVVAWINGHNHKGGYELHKNIHYLILQGMVETPSSTAYAVIDVYADRLVIRGRGREENRVLRFE